MDVMNVGDTRIRYEVTGDGPPVLLLAPGGMRSSIEFWDRMPWNPRTALTDEFTVIAMDQRNAGESWAPVSADDGWETHTSDQIALLDHLGVDRGHLLGMCIGGPYIMGLLRSQPDRFASAVMMQPIGLDDNRSVFYDLFDSWADEIRADHPEADETAWTAYREAMFGGSFLFNTTPDEVAATTTPILLCMGNDIYHPESTSRQVAELAPDCTFVEQWNGDALVDATNTLIHAYLADHSGAPDPAIALG